MDICGRPEGRLQPGVRPRYPTLTASIPPGLEVGGGGVYLRAEPQSHTYNVNMHCSGFIDPLQSSVDLL